ncbi:MAG: CHAT domain-containing protein [Phycisphaerae bacterium]|nr:CHAT domain-containing protein [Phycisphaerae bacterium]
MKIYIHNILAIICFCGIILAQDTSKKDADELYSKANDLVNKGENDKALSLFLKYLEIFQSLQPTNLLELAYANHDIADCYNRLNNNEEAVVYYLKAIEKYEAIEANNTYIDFAECYHNLAICEDRLNNCTNAKKHYLQAIHVYKKIKTDTPFDSIANCYYNLGYCSIVLEDYVASEKYFNEAISNYNKTKTEKFYADVAMCFYQLGKNSHRMDDYKKAKVYYEKALVEYNKIKSEIPFAKIARCYQAMANTAFLLEDYDYVKLLYNKALAAYGKIEKDIPYSRIADCYLAMAEDFNQWGDIKKAQTYYAKALEEYRKIKKDIPYYEIALCHEDIAFFFQQHKKYHKTLYHYKQAFSAYDKSNKAISYRKVSCCISIARAYEAVGNKGQAASKYLEALQHFPFIDDDDIGNKLYSKAYCWMKSGLLVGSEEIRSYKLSIDLLGKAVDSYENEGDHSNAVLCLYGIVSSYEALGDAKEAMRHRQKINNIQSKQNKLLGSNKNTEHADVGADLSRLDYAKKYENNAMHALNISEQIMFLKLAMENYQGHYLNTPHPDIAHCHISIGVRLKMKGNNESDNKAIIHFTKALNMFKSYYSNKPHYDIAWAHELLGSASNDINILQTAINIFEQCLQMHDISISERSRYNNRIANCNKNLGYVYQYHSKNLDKAIFHYQKAVALFESEPLTCREDIVSCLDSLWRLYAKQGELRAAEKCLSKMISELDRGSDLYIEKLNELYLLAAKLGAYELEFACMYELINMEWDYARYNLPYLNIEQKKQYLTKLPAKSYGNLILNSLFNLNIKKTAFYQKACNYSFNAIMHSKNILFDAQQKEQLIFSNELPDKLKEKYRKYLVLKKQYATLAMHQTDQMVLETDISNISPVGIRDLQKQIDELEQELRAGIPEFAQKVRLQEISVQDVKKALKPGQVLLEYVKYQVMDKNDPNDITLTDESHYAVFVLQGGTDTIEAVDLGPAKPLEALLRDCKKLIKEQGMELGNNVTISKTLKERAEKKLADLLSQIKSQTLPPEVFDHIKNADRLYIAPTSALMQFPFEILPITLGKLDYMVNKYELIYLNTSRDLVRLHLSASNQQKVANREMFIIGNPNFNLLLDKYKEVVSNIEAPTHTPSQHAQAEIEDIFPDTKIMLAGSEGGFYPAKKTDWRSFGYQLEAIKKIKCDLNNIYWGDNAVEEAFYANTDSRIINFATHGYYWENAPEGTNPLLRSMLVFAGINTYNTEMKNNPKFDPKINDCYLTAYEISGLDLSSTEFVNLVACQTGLGSDDDYQGVIGLRSSFILAGARSLSVSMWEVPAEDSAIQMQNFYDLWLDENPMKNRYRAFHQAQIKALNKKETSHPFFWAGFVYVGDPGDLVDIK